MVRVAWSHSFSPEWASWTVWESGYLLHWSVKIGHLAHLLDNYHIKLSLTSNTLQHLKRQHLICWYFLLCSDDRGPRHLEPPLLFNVETDPEETSPLPNVDHGDLLTNFSDALAQHLKTRKNKWHSQLDSRVVPFWFPCANFPHCFQVYDESNDFSDLFD